MVKLSPTPLCRKTRTQNVTQMCFTYSLTLGCFSFLAGTLSTYSRGNKEPAIGYCVKGRCNLVSAINLQLIFLGHLSAGSSLQCSNLSAYYVTCWPSSPYTLSLSVFFHLAYTYCIYSMSRL